jgi:adenylate kinase
VDKQKLIERISTRSQVEGRADDAAAIIETRFDEYMTKTAPVKEYYESKGLLVHINGDQTVENVQKEIISKL